MHIKLFCITYLYIPILYFVIKAIKSYIDNNGRLIIPVKIRKLLKILPDDKVEIKYIDNKLIVPSFCEKLERARALVKQYTKIFLIDELKKCELKMHVMNKKVLFDVSTLLILIQQGNNDNALEEVSKAVISSVNLREVISVLIRSCIPKEIANETIKSSITDIISSPKPKAELAEEF